MNSKEFNKLVDNIIKRDLQILRSKGRAYQTLNEDRFGQFRKAGDLQDLSPEEALYGFMSKHLVSLNDMCTHTYEFSMSEWEERLTDIRNYCYLLECMVKENKS